MDDMNKTDNTKKVGLPVKGYVAQHPDAIALVNENKTSEEKLLRRMDDMAKTGKYDQRWLAIARTQMEQAFMAMNRAVFKPERVTLDGDLD